MSGTRWIYDVESSAGRDRLEVLAHGEKAVRGSARPLFLFEETMDGSRYGPDGLEDSGWVGYFRSDGYWSRYAAVGSDGRGGFRLFGSGAVRVLPIDPHPGDAWEETTYLFENREARSGAQRWTAEIGSVPRLDTPAGRFRDLIVVHVRYWDPALSESEPLLRYEDVYARGVGLVRSVARNAIDPRADLEQVLVSVEFPLAAIPAPEGRP